MQKQERIPQRQVRLRESFVQKAQKRADISFRSLNQQIEYLGEIGCVMEVHLTPEQLHAIATKKVEIQLVPVVSPRVELSQVTEEMEMDRANGTLARKVSQAKMRFEASPDHPDMVVRIRNGKRELGIFADGKFTPSAPAKKRK